MLAARNPAIVIAIINPKATSQIGRALWYYRHYDEEPFSLDTATRPPGNVCLNVGWHSRCDDLACSRRCRRVGCLEPSTHWLIRSALHIYDCTQPLPLTCPQRTPAEKRDYAAARRVLAEILSRLEAV